METNLSGISFSQLLGNGGIDSNVLMQKASRSTLLDFRSVMASQKASSTNNSVSDSSNHSSKSASPSVQQNQPSGKNEQGSSASEKIAAKTPQKNDDVDTSKTESSSAKQGDETQHVAKDQSQSDSSATEEKPEGTKDRQTLASTSEKSTASHSTDATEDSAAQGGTTELSSVSIPSPLKEMNLPVQVDLDSTADFNPLVQWLNMDGESLAIDLPVDSEMTLENLVETINQLIDQLQTGSIPDALAQQLEQFTLQGEGGEPASLSQMIGALVSESLVDSQGQLAVSQTDADAIADELAALMDRLALMDQNQRQSLVNKPLADAVLAEQQKYAASATAASASSGESALAATADLLADSKTLTANSQSASTTLPNAATTDLVKGLQGLKEAIASQPSTDGTEADATLVTDGRQGAATSLAETLKSLVGGAGTSPAATQIDVGKAAVVSTDKASIDSSVAVAAQTAANQNRNGATATGVTTAQPSTFAESLKTAFGQNQWNNAVAEKVMMMASQNLSSAEIQLDPPELGMLQVRVTINHDQASVSFVSPHVQVRDALDQTAARLREMFDAEGLNLVDVDVSDQSFQQQRDGESGSQSGAQGLADGSGEGATTDETQPQMTVSRGLVDQFV